MTKPLYMKGLYVLCPECERDALYIVEDVFPLTPLRRTNFQAIAPTTMRDGDPIVSGCCAAPLLDGPLGARKFVSLRTVDAPEMTTPTFWRGRR